MDVFVDPWTWLNGLLAAGGLGALKYVLRIHDRSSDCYPLRQRTLEVDRLWLRLSKPWQPLLLLALAALLGGLEAAVGLGGAGLEGVLAAVLVAVGLRETVVRFVKPHVPDEYRVPRG